MKKISCLILLLVAQTALIRGQSSENSPERAAYQAELKALGKSFSGWFYPGYADIHKLPEEDFVSKIDSVRFRFGALLRKYKDGLDSAFVSQQQTEIKYYFDKILLDYPNAHSTYLQITTPTPSAGLAARLDQNLADFNKPELLTNTDFTEYVKAWLYHAAVSAKAHGHARHQGNQLLEFIWAKLPVIFTNRTCREYWQYTYLTAHLDDNGIKYLDGILNDFRATCTDTAYLNKINQSYAADSAGRKDHLIVSYKTFPDFTLDLHLFLPDTSDGKKARPVYVYVHGGSWSEGKPDWGFSSCAAYARKGWVGVAVEYRTVGRHGSLPFESVMDVRSAIRWLREHAGIYQIDTQRIVAAGNSAGGHLVLATALADRWNDRSDRLQFSPVPNAMLVNAAAFDLTVENTSWISKNLSDKSLVKEISPNHLIKKGTPPLLLIHGTRDRNCPYPTAEKFRDEMVKAGNTLSFHPLEGAGHFFWTDPAWVQQIARWRHDFLTSLGYDLTD